MTGNGNAHLPGTEWEGLRTPWTVKNLAESPILPPGTNRVELRRDERYGIEAKIVGTPEGLSADLLSDLGEPGVLVPGHRIEGTSHFGSYLYRLERCVVSSVSVSGTGRLEADLRTSRARRTANGERGTRAWLTEWYLNAHNGSMLYTRAVERELEQTYRRKRSYPEEEAVFEGGGSLALGGYAYVETPDLCFVLEYAPEEEGPSWSRNFAIEYREEWGGVPEEGTRASIANAVSFVVGRPLIRVGHTAFDGRGRAIEEVAVAPPPDVDLVSVCRREEQPPAKLHEGRPTDRFEALLARLVPRYLASKDELDLDDVLWNYWLSERLPLGANLPVLATGLETLKKAWYSSKKSKSKGVYMPKKEFDKLLGDELAVAEEKLGKVEYGDRIARRMRGAFGFGANESLEFFFEELGLPIGPAERSALKARNPMAHGSSTLLDESKYQEMVDATLAYRTLLNRVLLKVLDHEGGYVDYSATGWPERPLEEPPSGRE